MLYTALRALARIALRWYYSDVIVQGSSRIPAVGPVLVVANHPNALVDALLVSTTIPRRIFLTAKATLFEHPLLARLLAAVGVVPILRAQDVRASARPVSRSVNNEDAFLFVTSALGRGAV